MCDGACLPPCDRPCCPGRVKQASRGKHEWASLPVPTSKSYLLVPGLLAGTRYQFSVLPQNKLGSGAFSEIVSAQTPGLCPAAPWRRRRRRFGPLTLPRRLPL